MKLIITVFFILITLPIFAQSDSLVSDTIKIQEPYYEGTDELDKIYRHVQKMPFLPQCKGDTNILKRNNCTLTEISKCIKQYYTYPDSALDLNLSGTIYIQFVVNTKGLVTKVEVLKGVHPILDKSGVDAVKKIPQMTPGMQFEKPVSVLFSVPIRIEADENKKSRRKKK
jgi:periplasmic protein TonB